MDIKVVLLNEDKNISYISRKYNVPVHILKKANGTDEFKKGMRIIVPKLKGKLYSVKPNENLESIANKFNVSLQNLIDENFGIEKTYLGQKLIIPETNKSAKLDDTINKIINDK